MQYLLIAIIVVSLAALGFVLFRALDLGKYFTGLLDRLLGRKQPAGVTSGARGPSLPQGTGAVVNPSAALQRELEARRLKLEAQSQQVSRRNRYLGIALAAGVVLLLGILWTLYQNAVRAYAVLEDVEISRSPANQGRLEISFRVVRPGKVFYQRTSGRVQTAVVDYFHSPQPVRRAWSWGYEPGKEIDVSILYRGGLWRATQRQVLPTSKVADIVILMDTTESMGRSIALLKEKCVAFSKALKEKELEHRFALIGFGDTREGKWVEVHDFTADVEKFQQHVANVERFPGGDLPESSLDALERALELPFGTNSVRRFYLVTDALYRDEPTKSGLTVSQLASRLAEKRILLEVFARPEKEFQDAYAKLLGPSGKFHELESFGKVLTEGRVLED